MALADELREIFSSAGCYAPFRCVECEVAGNFISGPHSHKCSVCGERASYGWYTTPLCIEHFKERLNG